MLSKIDYNDVVSSPVPEYLLKRLQRVQFAAAGFVFNRYARFTDVVSLGWLPILERRNYHLAKLAYKAMNCDDCMAFILKIRGIYSYKNITIIICPASSSPYLCIISGTFQDEAARVFNSLPEEIRNCDTFKDYCRNSSEYFKTLVKNRISDTS